MMTTYVDICPVCKICNGTNCHFGHHPASIDRLSYADGIFYCALLCMMCYLIYAAKVQALLLSLIRMTYRTYLKKCQWHFFIRLLLGVHITRYYAFAVYGDIETYENSIIFSRQHFFIGLYDVWGTIWYIVILGKKAYA